jgi:hypothetical protein
MVRVLSVVAAIAAMLLVGGVAQASPGRYEVVGKWTLTNPAGSGGIIVPDMQDDYVEVRCEEGDLLRSYEINVSKVGSADTKILEIRITCRPA